MSNLTVRLITALIGAPAILALLYLGPAWGWFLFINAACVIASIELYTMTHANDRISQFVCTICSLGILSALWFGETNAKILMTTFLLCPIVALLLALFRPGDIPSSAARLTAAGFGPLYIGGGLGATALVRKAGGADGASYVVLLLMFAWLSDTFAYFAGRFFGKHKLYELISPKKTIEGSIGGLLGSISGAIFAHFVLIPSLPLSHGIILAMIGGTLGQMGDLGESLFKRSYGIKDSGGILPGHGGLLDRIDSVLMTAIVTYAYLVWFTHT